MRVPIGVKLAIMTVLILLAVAIPSTQITSKNFAETVSRREENINLDSAAGRASHIESILENWIDKTKTAAGALMNGSDSKEASQQKTDLGILSDRGFFAIEVRKVDGTVERKIVKDALLAEICGQTPVASAATNAGTSAGTSGVPGRRCGAEGFHEIVARAGFPVASVIDGNVEV